MPTPRRLLLGVVLAMAALPALGLQAVVAAEATGHRHPATAPPAPPIDAAWHEAWPGTLGVPGNPGLYVDHRLGDVNPRAKYPPDPHGAAGPRGVILVSNGRITYALKNQVVLWQTDWLEGFFTGWHAQHVLVDPRAAYDPQSGRFYVMTLETRYPDDSPIERRSWVHLAVSKNSHPATQGPDDWWFYDFEVTLVEGSYRYGIDYPGFGFDVATIYVTGNMFSLPIDGGSGFRGVSIIAIDKAQALAGSKLWTRTLAPTSGPGGLGAGYTLQPATVVGGTAPAGVAYFCEVPYFGPTTAIRLWALRDPFGNPSLGSTLVTVPDWGGAYSYAPQCGSSAWVRTWSPTAQGNAFWRDGSLWFCHTGSAAGRSDVRWYRIATNGYPSGVPSLVETGVHAGGPGEWNYQPAIGGNALGDVAIVFTQSGSLVCPTIMYSARAAGSATFTPPAPLAVSPMAAGTGPDPGYAPWGDYGVVAEDPVDHGLWVGHQQVVGPAVREWTTVWGHLRFERDDVGWPTDGRSVRLAQVPVADPRVIADGSGGVILAWIESGALYSQRLQSDGSRAPGWPDRGVHLFPGRGAPLTDLELASDGSGGAYVACRFGASGYLTRLGGGGQTTPGWSVDGTPLGALDAPARLVADGAGGVIAAFEAAGLRGRRFAGDGTDLWAPSGVLLDVAGYAPALVADGAGGATIAWSPGFAQRLDAAGRPAWPAGGVGFAAEAESPAAISDGAGGVVIVYEVTGADGAADVHAQRLDASGLVAAGWAATGVPLAVAPRTQTGAVLAPDGAGGAVVAWRDRRSTTGSKTDVYATRLAGDGEIAPGWSPGGLVVCEAAGDQLALSLEPDGLGGLIVCWADRRSNPGCVTGACGDDVYAARVLADGRFDSGYGAGGVPIASGPGNQVAPATALAAPGSLVVAWADGRLTPDCDPWCAVELVAQRVVFDAVPPDPVTVAGFPARQGAAFAWHTTGDDGTAGVATSFELRIASVPFEPGAFAGAGTPIEGPAATPAGTMQCVEVFGLADCAAFWAAVVLRDAAGNASIPSNTIESRTHCAGAAPASCAEVVGVEIPRTEGRAAAVELSTPQPNPARARGAPVHFGLRAAPEAGAAPPGLAVFDLAGRRIRVIELPANHAGTQDAEWDLRTDDGGWAPPGLYVIRLRAGKSQVTRRLILH